VTGDATLALFGRVDVLVNNASTPGGMLRGPLAEADDIRPAIWDPVGQLAFSPREEAAAQRRASAIVSAWCSGPSCRAAGSCELRGRVRLR